MGAEEDALRLEIELTRAQLDRKVDVLAAQLSPRRVVERSVEQPLQTGVPLALVLGAAVAALVLPRTRVERAVVKGHKQTTIERLLAIVG